VSVSEVLARRRRERERLIGLARDWAAALPERLQVRAAVVFGSVARGDFNKWSDIDVLVVAEGLPAGAQERLELLMEGSPPGLEPIGWTPAELAERRRRGDPIAIEATSQGVVVAGSLEAV
jgi:predicted nucleotidyltransferase